MSKRNRVRNQILNPLSDDSKFLESFAGIYKQLENIESSNLSKNLKIMPSFPLWNSYLWEKNILECNENNVFDLFHTLKIQCSANVVNEWKDWMNQ